MWACAVCAQTFTRKNNCVKHEQTCTGPKELKCGLCGEVFQDKYRKYRHTKRCTGPAPEPSTTVVISNSNNNNVNIDNSTTNNNNYNFNHIKVNDFHRTKVGPTVNNLMRNPAPIQLANERKHDKLEETLAQATYWATPENRNVLGIESHGRNMFVQMGGKKGVIDRKEGIARMIKTVRDVVRAPEIRDLLGPCIRLADIEDAKEFVALRPKYANVIENGGEFGNSILVPEPRPYFLPDDELRAGLLAILEKVRPDCKLPRIPFGNLIVKVCARFGYADGRWFVGSGGLVGELTHAQVIRRIELTHLPHEEPEPLQLHPSQVDRTKVGWQLIPNPIINGYGIPTYFHFLVSIRLKDTIMSMSEEFSVTVSTTDDDALATDLKRTLESIQKVLTDFHNIEDIVRSVLQQMKNYKSEGIPINWEEYAL